MRFDEDRIQQLPGGHHLVVARIELAQAVSCEDLSESSLLILVAWPKMTEDLGIELPPPPPGLDQRDAHDRLYDALQLRTQDIGAASYAYRALEQEVVSFAACYRALGLATCR